MQITIFLQQVMEVPSTNPFEIHKNLYNNNNLWNLIFKMDRVTFGICILIDPEKLVKIAIMMFRLKIG